MLMKKKKDDDEKKAAAKKAAAEKAVDRDAVLPPHSSSPVREVESPPAPPLTKVRFRRQDGMFSPSGGVYELPEKQASKFVRQGSAEYVDREE